MYNFLNAYTLLFLKFYDIIVLLYTFSVNISIQNSAFRTVTNKTCFNLGSMTIYNTVTRSTDVEKNSMNHIHILILLRR